jgi:hypothetical protein
VIVETLNRKGSTMQAREQFALAVRIIGILGLMYVLRTFVRTPYPQVGYLIVRLACVIIGAYMVRGAPWLVNFAYPEATPKAPDKTAE